MNPRQFAALAAKFLARTTMAPHERPEFSAVESVLQRLREGALVLGTPQKEDAEPAEKPSDGK